MGSAPTNSAPTLRLVAERFELQRLIGEGTFAQVYRARDLSTGATVAIKVLKEGPRSDAEAVERLRREVFAVAAIDSPHVVKLHDFGMSSDDMFIAMEYVEGPPLRDLLGGKPLSPDAAHIIVGQIAQAVAAAHERGIIHRDLKPENVVLVRGSRGRQVKVLDFGLAKLVELEQPLGLSPLTQTGMCFGTPQYMSPEQIQGRLAERSSDLWALAVIAYEVVAGHLPWDGQDIRDVFYAVMGKPLPRIDRAHPSLVRLDEINQFFRRALSPRVEERLGDAAALFGAFEQALFGGPHAPAATVFSGIISAEFALPAGEDDAPPAEPTLDDARLAVTPDTTQPGSRSSSKRRLHSVWSAGLQSPSPLSATGPDEASRLAQPPDVSPSLDKTAEDIVKPPPPSQPPVVAAPPPPAVGPQSVAAPALPPPVRPAQISKVLVSLLALLLAIAVGVAGYLIGRTR